EPPREHSRGGKVCRLLSTQRGDRQRINYDVGGQYRISAGISSEARDLLKRSIRAQSLAHFLSNRLRPSETFRFNHLRLPTSVIVDPEIVLLLVHDGRPS